MSDQAQACPHCGAPVQKPAPSTAGATSTGIGRGVRSIVLVGLVAVLGFIVYRVSRPALQNAGVVPSARFAIDNAGGDESCTTLGDYCMRVRCAVTNIGDASGTSRLAADFVEDGKVIATHRGTTQLLAPGQHDTLTLDFPEATLASREHQYRCHSEQ
jgi:hypothetical protein